MGVSEIRGAFGSILGAPDFRKPPCHVDEPVEASGFRV